MSSPLAGMALATRMGNLLSVDPLGTVLPTHIHGDALVLDAGQDA